MPFFFRFQVRHGEGTRAGPGKRAEELGPKQIAENVLKTIRKRKKNGQRAQPCIEQTFQRCAFL